MNLLFALSLLLQDPTFADVDPKPAIEAAKKKAASENRRVLVVWGSNDDEGSRAVAAMLKKDKQVARVVLYEYDVVFADIRRMEPGKPRIAIIPLLDILDAGGKELAGAPKPADAKEMIALLEKHKAPPLVAQEVLDAAKKKAAEEKKRVLLTFGAPW